MLITVDSESNDVLDAKMIELENLKEHKVYEEVKDEGQPVVGVRWIVTNKIKEGVSKTKARLVAKGFQEKFDTDIRKDSPTLPSLIVVPSPNSIFPEICQLISNF